MKHRVLYKDLVWIKKILLMKAKEFYVKIRLQSKIFIMKDKSLNNYLI